MKLTNFSLCAAVYVAVVEMGWLVEYKGSGGFLVLSFV